MRWFLIVVEKAGNNFSAYLHVKGLREDRLPIPEPSAVAEYVEVAS